MIERRVVIGSRVGLHARPAALFVRTVSKLPIDVSLAKNGAEAVDARSIISVLSLDIAGGDEVTLSTTAPDGGEHLDALTELLSTDLDAHA